MRIALSFLGLFFSVLSFGQLKCIKLTDEEIQMIGFKLDPINLAGDFTNEEVEKLNLKNTIDFLLEIKYGNKVLNSYIVGLTHHLGNGYSTYYWTNSKLYMCFNIKDLSNEILFDLLKERDWEMRKVSEDEQYICNQHSGIRIFQKNDNKEYKLNTLLDGKIQMSLYRLEK